MTYHFKIKTFFYATDMLQQGIDVRTVQALLGHKNLNTTMIYPHIVEKLNKDNVKSSLNF